MTIKFFNGIKNRDELRKVYLKLMKKHHPDNGGDTETCKQINAEYDYLSKMLPASGTSDNAKQREADTAREIKIDAAIKAVIDKLMHMSGIKVEICGSWVWVDGLSYPWREELAKIGFKWSRARRKWHYTPNDDTGWHRGSKKTFDQIRAAYGSMIVDMPGAAAQIAG